MIPVQLTSLLVYLYYLALVHVSTLSLYLALNAHTLLRGISTELRTL
jgi:hypothetical protein